MNINNKKIAETAAASALALVLGYIESLFPFLLPVPGIKLGLSNLCLLFALYRLGIKTTWGIMIIKVTLSALLFNGFQTFWFSLSGGILSVLSMSLTQKFEFFSINGVSILSAAAHNIGQLLTAAYILKTTSVFLYLPPLLISGAVTGLLIGILCGLILKYLDRTQ